jgi:hypothetical protein
MAWNNKGPRPGLGRKGSALVEFALVLPVFLLVVVGLVYFCLLIWVHASLQYAVDDASRCARVRTDICASAAATTAYAHTRYFGMGSPTFTYSQATCGHRVSASVVAPAAGYIPLRLLGVSSSTLTATACFP